MRSWNLLLASPSPFQANTYRHEVMGMRPNEIMSYGTFGSVQMHINQRQRHALLPGFVPEFYNSFPVHRHNTVVFLLLSDPRYCVFGAECTEERRRQCALVRRFNAIINPRPRIAGVWGSPCATTYSVDIATLCLSFHGKRIARLPSLESYEHTHIHPTEVNR